MLLTVLTAILALTASQPPATDASKASGPVRLDGSSTVFLISEAAAEEFKKIAPKVNVSVGISGTGGGFKRFCAGEIDVTAASRAIKPGEVALARKNNIEFVEVPVAFDGLSVVVNKSNTWATSLTIADLKRIYMDGGVKIWSELNPAWPNEAIQIFSPGTDSGTFDYFKEAIIGMDGKVRGDISVSEDDNMLVRGILDNKNAIGFFGIAYLMENEGKLRGVAIDGGKGPVAPSPETVENGSYQPLGRPLFYYVNAASLAKPQVVAFVDYLVAKAPEFAPEVGYIKFPEDLQSMVRANWMARRTGTQFVGADGNIVHGTFRSVYR
jgi:phosphate transport system substrate-binding protein